MDKILNAFWAKMWQGGKQQNTEFCRLVYIAMFQDTEEGMTILRECVHSSPPPAAGEKVVVKVDDFVKAAGKAYTNYVSKQRPKTLARERLLQEYERVRNSFCSVCIGP